jgi:antitoxin (DNA-binding transcriptional repressor) of toxin-antitoxin stability system
VGSKPSVSIKELHQQTGEIVRASAQSVTPIAITERGKIIAYLVAPPLVNKNRTERVLLPGYAAMMKNPPQSDVLKALDEDRGE